MYIQDKVAEYADEIFERMDNVSSIRIRQSPASVDAHPPHPTYLHVTSHLPHSALHVSAAWLVHPAHLQKKHNPFHFSSFQ